MLRVKLCVRGEISIKKNYVEMSQKSGISRRRNINNKMNLVEFLKSVVEERTPILKQATKKNLRKKD